ncbi:MAG: hypothetical protein ACRDGE_04925 [Candidatus Limnocylindria bacterium]
MGTSGRHAVHAVVGDLPRRESIAAAVASLTRAGFRPERVTIIAGDPELARDVGGRSYTAIGVIAGAFTGAGFVILVLLMGGPQMLVNPVGLVIGAIGVIGGLAFIGLVFGRSIVRRCEDAQLFAEEVARGDALIAVACEGEACDKAREALVAAGAAEVRAEESCGPT